MSAEFQRAAASGIARLLEHYRMLPGVCDELLDANGQVRAHWNSFLSTLAMLSEADPDELPRRFNAADSYLREAGVFHRVYEGPARGSDRPWPLSHMPLLIEPGEWADLCRGLQQRAGLLEAILGDAYGPQLMSQRGLLPASLIAGSPEFHRPLVGAVPRGGHHLWFYAADLGRGPDGRWWVLGDRTQAPSGAGYALENRVALGRALADVSRQLNVQRLAGFFQAFQRALTACKSAESARVGLLSPGQSNETYFEHAYLARYLGFLLLEGEDLTVRQNRVYVRTVTGLKPIDVLWRRLDSEFADPLELNGASRIGVPGLVRAVRTGNVLVANSIGSGLLEARALLGFLPGLCRELLGQELALPSIATWWCGQEAERRMVLDDLDDFAIAPAYDSDLPAKGIDDMMLPRDLEPAARRKLAQAIADRGIDYVAQENVHLSTTPVWNNGRLEPKPCIVRVFLARTSDGWTVMPGAFCRISESNDARVVTMQRGSRSADVWVLSDSPQQDTTLLAGETDPQIRRLPGTLPSRAADNLFWMGRYVERAEGLLRLLRVYANRVAAIAVVRDPIQQEVEDELLHSGVVTAKVARFGTGPLIAAAVSGTTSGGSLADVIEAAKLAASRVRDRLSPDAWAALCELESQFARDTGDLRPGSELIDLTGRGLRTVAAFSGLVQENISRLTGWRFLEIGRRIERGLQMARFARRFARADAPVGSLDTLLDLCDAAMTYRQRYSIATVRSSVIDLVILDPNNPRSVAFQANAIHQRIFELPGRRIGDEPAAVESLAVRLDALLQTTRAAQVDEPMLEQIGQDLRELSNLLTQQYFSDRHIPAADWD